MDLTFQVTMQYCSFQHQTLLSPPDTSTTECHFHFGPTSFFLLKLFPCSFPVVYWIPSDLGGSSSGVLSYCLFILFMGFSWQEYWSDLPFPPPVAYVLSELFTMYDLSVLHSTAHIFIALHSKLVCHNRL